MSSTPFSEIRFASSEERILACSFADGLSCYFADTALLLAAALTNFTSHGKTKNKRPLRENERPSFIKFSYRHGDKKRCLSPSASLTRGQHWLGSGDYSAVGECMHLTKSGDIALTQHTLFSCMRRSQRSERRMGVEDSSCLSNEHW